MSDTAIDERIDLLRSLLSFYGESLGWDHVAAEPRRQACIIHSMQWAASEIGRINDREYRLTAPVHPDILQSEVWSALRRHDLELRQAERESAASARGMPTSEIRGAMK